MTINNVKDQKQIDKAIIKRISNGIGFAFVVGFAFNEVLGELLGIFSQMTGINIFSTDISIWIYQIVVSTLMFTVPFIVFAPLMNIRIGDACRLKKAEKGTVFPVVLMGIGFIVIANYLGNMAYVFFSALGLSNDSSALSTSASEGIIVPIVAIIAGSVLPAFLEEFALRGVALGALRRYGSGFAIMISSVAFSIMHGNMEQIPFAFLMGIYLGFAVEKTGSLWIGILLHLINNFFSFGFQILEEFIGEGSSAALSLCYFIGALFLGFIGFVIAASKKDFFRLESKKEGGEETLSYSEKLRACIFTPGMIIFIAFVIYKIVSRVITI